MFSTIWFISARACYKKKYFHKTGFFWIILSILLLALTLNVTSGILLVSAIIIWQYYQLKRYKLFIFLLSFSFISSLIYIYISSGYLFSRVFNNRQVNLTGNREFWNNYGLLHEVENLTTIQFYVYNFIAPLKVFLSESYFNQLFGVGNKYVGNQIFIGGDFAFGSMILFNGIIFSFLFAISIVYLLFQNINIYRYDSVDQRTWQFIGFSCALISILFLISTIHYPQALSNLGGSVVFSLFIALASYAKFRFNSLLISENEY